MGMAAKQTGIPLLITWARRLAPLLSIGIFTVALVLLHHMLARFRLSDVTAQLANTSPTSLWSAGMLTAASYLALAGFDGLGASYIGRHVAPARIVLISFVSHAVSHSAGFATLTGGAIRLRMYSGAGLTSGEVATVVAFCGLTFGLGASSVAAMALVSEPRLLAAILHLPTWLLRSLGVMLALAVAAYVCWGAWAMRPYVLFGRTFFVPKPRLAALQIAVAASDLALASAVLFVLLPTAGRGSYPAFLGAYVVANLLGLLAHVPGGLGVFDAAILVLTPDAPKEAVLGSLLLFRTFYNLLPLTLAAVILLVYEILERVPRLGRRIGGLFDELGPPLLAISVFAAGGLTVLARALPAPLKGGVVDHSVGIAEGAAGCVLMLLARGLNRRNRVARWAGVGLLAVLFALLLAQVHMAPRAVAVAVLAAILALSNDLTDPADRSRPPLPSLAWSLAIGAVLAAAFWMTEWQARSQLLPATAAAPALLADATAAGVFLSALVLGRSFALFK